MRILAYALIPLAMLALPAAAQARTENAVLAGGCFWGMEAVFEHVKGVHQVISGYAGGSASSANYGAVSSERTAHAEAVRVRFDPDVVSYSTLLRIYFTVAHDPTQLNRQGPDSGPSYRSAIFPQSASQKAAASAFIKRLDASGPYKGRVATRVESGQFYAAEDYHQDFARRNPTHPYIRQWDEPKIVALKRRYPDLFVG